MILLIGASASGKTEVSKTLRKKYGIIKAITHTTRAPRPGENNAVDYYFVSEESFLQLERKDSFVETTIYNGNHYGCSKSEIADDKLVIVDPEGLKSFSKLNDNSIVSFYLYANEETRKKRMKERGDNEENIQKRIENDKIAFAKEKVELADFSIDTSEKTLNELAAKIYSSYISTLKKRGINNPNVIII